MDYKALGLIALFILVLDYIWLNHIFGSVFSDMVTDIQAEPTQVRIVPAIIVYILMIIGLYVFVYTRVENVMQALMYGALFGLVTFGIFDFTNAALFTDYNYSIASIDVVWGVILNSMTAGLSVYLLKSKK